MCRLVATHNIAPCSVVFPFIEHSSTFWIMIAPPSSALIINISVLLESSPKACFSLDVRLFLVALSNASLTPLLIAHNRVVVRVRCPVGFL